MHLVFATSIVPDGAPATGYEIANAAIIDALRRAGIRVTVLGFTWPGKAPADPENTVVLGSVDVRTDSASPLQKLAWLTRAVFEGVTFASVKLRTCQPRQGSRRAEGDRAVRRLCPQRGAAGRRVRGTVRRQAVDLRRAQCRVPLGRGKRRRGAQPDPETYVQPGGASARGISSVASATRPNSCSRLPTRTAPRSASKHAGKSAALPLVTPASTYVPAGKRAPAYDATLIGTWTWQPNRIGLEWFLDQVVPHLLDDFTIAIAGSIPADLRSPHPGVTFVGRVPDAIAFVLSGRVVPLISRAGSGVQLKTIETFELGLPAVATSRSLRGIGAVPANCTVADDPVEFAARARARQPAAPAMSMAHASAASSFGRSTVNLRLACSALGFQAERACA